MSPLHALAASFAPVTESPRASTRFDRTQFERLLQTAGNPQFFRLAYNLVLGREPDETALRTSLFELLSGKTSRVQLLQGLISSEEAELAGIDKQSALAALEQATVPPARVPESDLLTLLAVPDGDFPDALFQTLHKRPPSETERFQVNDILTSDGTLGRVHAILQVSELEGPATLSAEAGQFQVAATIRIGPGIRGGNSEYDLNQLLTGSTRDFLRNAYRAILNREPDPRALAYYASLLQRGALSRAQVLAELRWSSAGRAVAVKIPGLLPVHWRLRILSLPIVGPLLRIGSLLLNLGRLERSLRAVTEMSVSSAADTAALELRAEAFARKAQHTSDQISQLAAASGGLKTSAVQSVAALSRHADKIAHLEKTFGNLRQTVDSGLAGLRGQISAELNQRDLESLLAEIKTGLGSVQNALVSVMHAGAEVNAAIESLQKEKASLSEIMAFRNALANKVDAATFLGFQSQCERLYAEYGRRQDEIMQALGDKASTAEVRKLEAEKASWPTVVDLLGSRVDRTELDRILETDRRNLSQAFERLSRLDATLAGYNSQLSFLLDRSGTQQECDQLSAVYMDLEDLFRGSTRDIAERQSIYLDRVRQAGAGTPHRPVLDIGCGRGEWLNLLRDHNLTARGIDVNPDSISRCRALGLQVEPGEIAQYLKSLPDDSLGFITAFHVIEHIPVERILVVLEEAFRVLRPGGGLVLETPNPENILVGSCTFYTDPTHRKPIPSSLLRFLFEKRNFVNVEIIPLHPDAAHLNIEGGELARRFNQLVYGPRDYAAAGIKPPQC